MPIEILEADYHNPQHQRDIPELLNAYALDPMGGSEPLSAEVREVLVSKLAQLPHAFSVLAYVDGKPAGLTNCFEGFSTFAAKPIVNIHDIAVHPEFRGLGLSQKMLDKVEEIARRKGCCKLTLEVLSNNDIAQNAYRKFGFAGYELGEISGHALFWQKKLK
ncbi:GNAT family N-acetyltransferase [Pokkaliibacter sp. CJK22405]|uniref:GNAT family N-acetyltransferase n=1 Tax=Pokkaliibacter sp. CJK22405 TaxID=3384615 RepID=UPI00398484D4